MGVIYDESGCGSGMGEDTAPVSHLRVTDEMIERGTTAILNRVPLGYGMMRTEAKAYSEAAIRAALTTEGQPGPKEHATDCEQRYHSCTCGYERHLEKIAAEICR
jgi:hypothetical protein